MEAIQHEPDPLGRREVRGGRVTGRVREKESDLALPEQCAHARPRGGGGTVVVRLTGSWTASGAGIVVDLESRRRGSPICALARKLIEAGHDPAAELHVYRGETLCFKPVPLAKWAGVVIEEGDNTCKSARFAKYRLPNPQSARETDDSGVGLGRLTGHLALPGDQMPERANGALRAAPGAAGEGPPLQVSQAAGGPPSPRGATPAAASSIGGTDDQAA